MNGECDAYMTCSKVAAKIERCCASYIRPLGMTSLSHSVLIFIHEHLTCQFVIGCVDSSTIWCKAYVCRLVEAMAIVCGDRVEWRRVAPVPPKALIELQLIERMAVPDTAK